MKLKLSLQRASGPTTDVVLITEPTAAVGDVAREIVEQDPLAAETMRSAAEVTLAVAPPGGGRPVVLPTERILGEAPVASGSVVSVVESVSGSRSTVVAATMRIESGPDAGRQVNLPPGSTVVGRDTAADVVLNDQFVSKRHARVEVGATIEVIDLNSANGIVVDGSVVSRVAMLPGQVVQLGDTRLSFAMVAGHQPGMSSPDIRGGAIPFNRSPRVEERYPEHQHPRPAVPVEPTPAPFPFLMMVAPIVMGTAMFTITGNPMSLLFVAMAPLMMTSNFVNRKLRNNRQLAMDSEKFTEQLRVLEQRLREAMPEEHRVRQAEVPAVALVYQAGIERSDLLWTRRPEHWTALNVRLGTATLPSRHTVAEAHDMDEGMPKYARLLEEVEERYREVPDVPVVESLFTAGALGIVGPVQQAADAVRGTLLQVAGLHSPAEVVLTAIASPDETPAIDWMRWLPHTSSPQSPLSGSHLVDTQTTATGLVSSLEQLVDERLGRRASMAAERLGPLSNDLESTARGGTVGVVDDKSDDDDVPLPIVIVLVTEDAPIDRPRVVQLFERAHSVGVFPIWVGSTRGRLPAMCRTFLDVTGGLGTAEAHFVRHGQVVKDVRVEGVSVEHALRFAMALAPLADDGAVTDDSSDLPRQVSMVTLVGTELRSSGEAVLDRWRQNFSVHERDKPPRPLPRTGTLRALVGQGATDAMHLDLRAQGPHALVGGTTGSGKSEFLQSWVLGMAAEYSPDRVTFLFVDYKGGAAFADCVKLPHCVGLVTDLSPHLVRRALTSLRAELHHRELVLQRKRAKDLLELEKRGDPESPPALILVIDEFAALVSEVPEFVDGVVDIAQRGRSLGIHLIMATQRPAGVIKDNLRANTNLRIALRMADESDSADVIDSKEAAHFDPSIPGRAVAKMGPGRLIPFQSAYAGGHTTDEVVPATVHLHALKFGAEERWRRRESDVEVEIADPGPTDQVRLVDTIGRASLLAELPEPRRPWLDELSEVYDLALLGPRTDTELLMGVADFPERQAQHVVAFKPDVDGNMAIYGTGGSGKSVLLRSLAAGAGVTPRGGPVHVYGLDFAAGGLRMLEALPHVGSIVSGDDDERIVRLLRTLRGIAEQRARDFPEVNAGSITEYRQATNRPDEPRILLLLDNFPAFREAYDSGGSRAQWYAVLQQLLSEGRQLGIHVVFTADRPASVPGSISSSVPRRVVLRLADETAYLVMGMPTDVLSAASPPGRAVIDGVETQVAVLGGSGNVADQSQAIGKLARAMQRQQVPPAPAVGSMPVEVPESSLPSEVGGRPVLGIGEEALQPIGVEPAGTFLLGGGPASGRTNAIVALARSLHRWKPDGELIYLGHRRSAVPRLAPWTQAVTDVAEIATLAKELAARVAAEDEGHIAVFVESIADFLSTPADAPIVELIRAIKRTDHFLVGESESGTWGSMYPLLSEIRNARRGMLLQPESIEGETLMRTPFGRFAKREFPPGRAMAVLKGKPVRVQVPWTGEED